MARQTAGLQYHNGMPFYNTLIILQGFITPFMDHDVSDERSSIGLVSNNRPVKFHIGPETSCRFPSQSDHWQASAVVYLANLNQDGVSISKTATLR